MSIEEVSKKSETTEATTAPADDHSHHNFRDTAMGLGLATTKATLTPIVGLGLMGVAAHDAVASGTNGTFHKAQDLLGQTKSDSEKIKACAMGSTTSDDAPDAAPDATLVEIFYLDGDGDCKIDWKHLRKNYIDKGIPFVRHKKGGSPISTAAPPQQPDPTDDSS